MIRIYHNYNLQTDPQHGEEEPQSHRNKTITRHQEETQNKAASSLFLTK